jgi:hypothetical protein
MIWFATGRTGKYIGSCLTIDEAQILKKSARNALEAARRYEYLCGRDGRAIFYSKESKRKMYFTIKARGPRDGNYHVTPKANATHFDVYMYERNS